MRKGEWYFISHDGGSAVAVLHTGGLIFVRDMDTDFLIAERARDLILTPVQWGELTRAIKNGFLDLEEE